MAKSEKLYVVDVYRKTGWWYTVSFQKKRHAKAFHRVINKSLDHTASRRF